MRTIIRTIAAAGLAASLAAPMPLAAQEAAAPAAELRGFWLTTAYPEMTIQPGETQSISLSLRNEKLPPQRAAIEVSGVPEGWEWALKGGGKDVTAAIVAPDSTERLTLELTPPEDAAADGEHAIEVRARTATDTIALPLVVRLSETQEAASGLSLEPELPALRGSARSTFSFKIKVRNEGAEDGLFNLAASVPNGFQTRFKKGYGSEEITGVPIAAGATETVTMEVVPSRAVAARQEQQLLLQALRRLPIEMQVALELFYWEELTVAEIAEVLETPVGTVKSRLQRARARLDQVIAELAESEDLLRSTVDNFERWARELQGRLAVVEEES